MAYVRLTDPVLEDLHNLYRLDPSVMRQVLKKMKLLEKDSLVGEPLLGTLVGWRKLTVGDRHWRIIWIPKTDSAGEQVIEISQVWAIGARSDSEIYEEVKGRIKSLPPSPMTTSLEDVLRLLGKSASGVQAASEPVGVQAPEWLRVRLKKSLGLDPQEIDDLSLEEALALWDEFIRKPK